MRSYGGGSALHFFFINFAEEKLHLGIASQASLMSLLSVCIFFAQVKLHKAQANIYE